VPADANTATAVFASNPARYFVDEDNSLGEFTFSVTNGASARHAVKVTGGLLEIQSVNFPAVSAVVKDTYNNFPTDALTKAANSATYNVFTLAQGAVSAYATPTFGIVAGTNNAAYQALRGNQAGATNYRVFNATGNVVVQVAAAAGPTDQYLQDFTVTRVHGSFSAGEASRSGSRSGSGSGSGSN